MKPLLSLVFSATAAAAMVVSSEDTSMILHPDRCSACRIATNFISEAISYGNMSLPVIEAGARIACAAELGEKVAPSCDLIINRLDDIIRWIGTGMTPSDVCRSLDLCPASAMGEALLMMPVMTMTLPLPDPCVLCTTVVTSLEAAVAQDNSTVAQFRTALSLVCNMLSDDEACHVLLTHFDLMAGWLESGLPPQIICEKLSLCSDRATSDESAVVAGRPVILPDPCETCVQVTEVMEEVIKDEPESVAFLRQGVEAACVYLGIDSKCDWVLSHFDEVAGWLTAGLAPKTVCEKLNLCFKAVALGEVAPSMMTLVQQKTQDLPCMLCTTISQEIQVMAEVDKADLPMLKQGLTQLCDYLPGMFKCAVLLDQFDALSQLLESGMAPADACAKIGMCGNSLPLLKSLSDPHSDVAPPLYLSEASCVFCTVISMSVSTLLKTNPTAIPVVKQSLGASCGAMPAVDKCDLLLNDFDALVTLLKSGTSPQQSCERLTLCHQAAAPTTTIVAAVMALE